MNSLKDKQIHRGISAPTRRSMYMTLLCTTLLLSCDPGSPKPQMMSGGGSEGLLETGGNAAGEDAGELAGELAGDIAGELAGELAGDIAGDVAGEAAGMTAGQETNESCMSPEEYFTQVAWPQVFQTTCTACHNPSSLAADSDLVFTELNETSPPENFDKVQRLIREQALGLPTLLLKPAGLHPEGHGGGRVLSMDDERLETLTNLAERTLEIRGECGELIEGQVPIQLSPPEGSCGELQPGRRLLRRLSHEEYRHTIFDLLGVEIDAKASFVADPSLHGFDNPPEELLVSSLLVNQYREMAEYIGEQVSLNDLISCSIPEGDIHCAHRFIVDFGLRAHRRPLTTEEVNRYLALYQTIVEQECFEQGVRWVIIAMLQSPHFLYRSELGWRDGDRFTLSAYEIASELSYLVWQSMPDEELLDLASEGQLLDATIAQEQLQRLLSDPKSVRTAQYFIERWLHLDRLMQVTRDSIIYAALYFEIREMMLTETRLLVQELWDSAAPLSSLFSSDHSWLNAELAEYYGVDLGEAHPQNPDYYRADVSSSRPAGVLTHGSFLTTHASPTSSSPILRGVTLREQVLCDHLDPPPEGVEIIPPIFDPSLSTRERFAAHTEDELCASCHRLIDPLGFAFENYDGIGRFRLTEGEESMLIDIDSSGILERSHGEATAFTNAGELSVLLAEDRQVQSCYVRQWLRFGIGESEGLDSDCYTETLLNRFQEDNFSLRSPLFSLTSTPHFYQRSGEDMELSLPGEAYLVKSVGGSPERVIEALPPETENPVCGIPPEAGGGSAETNDPRLSISLREDRWTTGYCIYVTVTNQSEEEVNGWTVQLVVEGTINNAWSVERSADSGPVDFTPVEWARVLPPQGSIDFGFCGAL